MFSYSGLSEAHVKMLRESFHIYILQSGRISLSGCKLSKHKVPSESELKLSAYQHSATQQHRVCR